MGVYLVLMGVCLIVMGLYLVFVGVYLVPLQKTQYFQRFAPSFFALITNTLSISVKERAA